jgi:hypothetical protein
VAEHYPYNAPVQRRLQVDRRRLPRGGRRLYDHGGLSPLVMVVERTAERRSVTEAVLALGHFAVAPVVSVEGALAVCSGLMPAVIVCAEDDIDRLRDGLRPFTLPIVASTRGDDEPRDLIERIRVALRGDRYALLKDRAT